MLCVGGGIRTAEQAAEIAVAGADIIVTACPFCTRVLEQAVREMGLQGRIAVQDLAMIVLESARPINEKMIAENTRLEVAHV